MKTRLLLIGILLINISMFGQIETKVFTLDLSKPSKNSLTVAPIPPLVPAVPGAPTPIVDTKKTLSFWSRQPIQFELVNGNPFKYKYVLNNKLVNFFDDKTDNPFDNLKKAIEAPVPKTPVSAEEDDQTPKAKAAEAQLEQLMAKATPAGNNLSAAEILKINTLVDKSKLPDPSVVYNEAAFIANYATIKATVSYNYKAINSYNYLLTIGLASLPSSIEEDRGNIVSALNSINSVADVLLSEINKYTETIKATERLNVPELQTNRDSYYDQFNTLSAVYNGTKRDAAQFDKQDKSYTALNDSVKATLKSILDNLGLLFKVKLDNYLLPIDVNGKNIDVVEVSLERFDGTNPVALDKYTYNLWVRGGFKIDISGGIFISSLVSKEYDVKDKSETVDGVTTTGKVITEKENGNFDFGFGSMINISHRSAGWVNPTLNVGAIFTAKQQFQLLTGLGLILGKEERIIFGGGLSMGRVSSISENLVADGTTMYDLGNGAVPVNNTFEFGYYFGVTYNFSKVKK